MENARGADQGGSVISGLHAALKLWRAELTALLADTPVEAPDLLPSAASIYIQKVAALAEVLNQPGKQAEAAEALRILIEKIVLTPGPARGEMFATLHGEGVNLALADAVDLAGAIASGQGWAAVSAVEEAMAARAEIAA